MVLALGIMASSTAVFADDNDACAYDDDYFYGTCKKTGSGNVAYTFTNSLYSSAENRWGDEVFRVTDKIQWSVNKKTKKFDSCNYSKSALSMKKPWCSLWQLVDRDALIWYDEDTQKEATGVAGLAWGVGITGSVKAEEYGAETSLNATIGQVALCWSETSINTISGYSDKVKLARYSYVDI